MGKGCCVKSCLLRIAFSESHMGQGYDAGFGAVEEEADLSEFGGLELGVLGCKIFEGDGVALEDDFG